ncbi:MAG: hypothetical protein HeimC3_33800 [Candidatus Heimdallarchaeota archaeon LC_3]|nr:MAG: hypothetical protein HeimC3_33800 [Candidatus Heimdallarchaeota archaeon LC_3]
MTKSVAHLFTTIDGILKDSIVHFISHESNGIILCQIHLPLKSKEHFTKDQIGLEGYCFGIMEGIAFKDYISSHNFKISLEDFDGGIIYDETIQEDGGNFTFQFITRSKGILMEDQISQIENLFPELGSIEQIAKIHLKSKYSRNKNEEFRLTIDVCQLNLSYFRKDLILKHYLNDCVKEKFSIFFVVGDKKYEIKEETKIEDHRTLKNYKFFLRIAKMKGKYNKCSTIDINTNFQPTLENSDFFQNMRRFLDELEINKIQHSINHQLVKKYWKSESTQIYGVPASRFLDLESYSDDLVLDGTFSSKRIQIIILQDIVEVINELLLLKIHPYEILRSFTLRLKGFISRIDDSPYNTLVNYLDPLELLSSWEFIQKRLKIDDPVVGNILTSILNELELFNSIIDNKKQKVYRLLNQNEIHIQKYLSHHLKNIEHLREIGSFSGRIDFVFFLNVDQTRVKIGIEVKKVKENNSFFNVIGQCFTRVIIDGVTHCIAVIFDLSDDQNFFKRYKARSQFGESVTVIIYSCPPLAGESE